MKISTAAREYLIEIEVRKFTPKTIRSYRNNRSLFLRYCETEAQITQDLLSAKSNTRNHTTVGRANRNLQISGCVLQ